MKCFQVGSVAEELACSERHILNLVRNGHLTAIRVGNRAIRITEESLDRFKQERVVDPEEYFV